MGLAEEDATCYKVNKEIIAFMKQEDITIIKTEDAAF